jgi:F-type H+-transporting ATPase subunit delta
MADDKLQNSDMDIDRQKLGAIYAKALLGSAHKAGNAQQVVDELTSFVDEVLNQVDGIDALLSTPRISAEEKLGILERTFAGKMSDELLTFLKVICRHGRLDCIRHIGRAVCKEFNQSQGLVEVQVVTAEPIDDALANRIQEVLKGTLNQQVELNCVVDKSLIGGLVVKIGDKVYDGSVANKLSRLREETIAKTVQQLRESPDRFATSG